MDYHQNARLTIYSRAELAKTVLEQGVTNTSGPATSSTSILNGWLGSSSPAIDNHSRISFAAILPDQNHQLAMLFFFMTRAFYSRFGFAIKRVLTDNGPCYRDGNFQTLLLQQRIKHRFTRPYTHAPTEKPNASSKPRYANGPTPAPTRPRSNDKTSSAPGSTTTTSTASMLASITTPNARARVSIGTTS